MNEFDSHDAWKRLRPIWIGGLVGLVTGILLYVVTQPDRLDLLKMVVPAHNVYGDLRLFDLRTVPFLLPFFGVGTGFAITLYRKAVVKHRRRR